MDGSGTRRLATGASGSLAFPIWSPDGARNLRWCITEHDDLFCEVAVMAADGSDKKTLVRQTGALYPSSGTPPWFWVENNTILIPSGFSVDASTGTAKLVESDPNARPFAVGADGTLGFLTTDRDGRRAWVVLTTTDGQVLVRDRLPKGAGVFGALWVS